MLVLAKKGTTSPTSLAYDRALEEAICFGLIDGQVRRRDERTYFQRSRLDGRGAGGRSATRRSPSGWPARAGCRRREWPRSSARRPTVVGRLPTPVPRRRARPDDLAAALAAEPKAKMMFSRLTRQNRYAILHRIEAVKRPESRARKVEEFVAMLARGETVHPQRRTKREPS